MRVGREGVGGKKEWERNDRRAHDLYRPNVSLFTLSSGVSFCDKRKRS